MRPTLAVLGKANRRPMLARQGNKDYYKGNRAAYLPGGHRTGAPGKHVVQGKAKYRIIDEQVRVFVAPPIDEIISSPLKAYVHRSVRKVRDDSGPYGHMEAGGLNGEHLLRLMRERHGAVSASPSSSSSTPPAQS
ncbi:hypothetical protein AURDEDRAFT_58750 [Auricularia subglabra TFB-10046 SS5]|nr:hypothetical protein AURDEDRAFT_58750 [Auricularia subglabra TFB-10046 SS5]